MDLWAMPNNLDVKDDYVYMQDYIGSVYTLVTIDVNNPDAPQLAGEYDSSAKDIFAKDTLVYILDNEDLKIVNLQDPLNPIPEGSLTLSDNALRICVSNGYAFIAGDGSYTLWIVDVSDCSNPQLVTSITTACNYARDIVVQGNLLYLVCNQHMQIINVGDINNPAVVSTYDEVTNATGICIKDNFAYIADYNLLKIDITEPSAPSLLEEYPIPGCCYNVAVLDDYLFVTTESSFLIFQDSDLLQIDDEDIVTPAGKALLQNFPNPFNQQTTIEYQITNWSHVSLNIYDLMGRKIRTLVDENQYAGSYSIFWDGNDNSGNVMTSGIYYCRLSQGDFTETKKILFVR